MKVWLVILTIACLLNYWFLVNAYERIAMLTLALERQGEYIIAHQIAIPLQGEKINELVDYLNKWRIE